MLGHGFTCTDTVTLIINEHCAAFSDGTTRRQVTIIQMSQILHTELLLSLDLSRSCKDVMQMRLYNLLQIFERATFGFVMLISLAGS